MALKVNIENFRILKNIEFDDPTKFSIITGYNESGKTSFCQAIKFALTGEAFGHRARNAANLLSWGEDRLAVRVRVGSLLASRTTTTGDAIKAVAERAGVPVDVLPLLWDAKMCGDGGSKHLATFLESAGSVRCDPLVHFANDQSAKYYVDQARRSGKTTTKQIISYCESMRAQQKPPPRPTRPEVAKPDPSEIDRQEKAASAALSDLSDRQNELTEYRDTAARLSAILNFQKDMEQFEELKKQASVGDPLGDTRDALTRVANINQQTLTNITQMLEKAGGEYVEAARAVEPAAKLVEKASETAKKKLEDNPPPPSAPKTPVLPQDCLEIYQELEKVGELDKVRQYLTDLVEEEQKLVRGLDAERNTYDLIKAQVNQLYQSKGAWEQYESAEAEYDGAAVHAKQEWERWNHAAKEIAAAESEHLSKIGDHFGSLVSDLSGLLLQGRRVKIDRTDGIFLNNLSISECSESTQWRIEVAIMAAIARTMQSPLLVVDGADVLDVNNRESFIEFVLQHVCPHFEHVIVTTTARGKIEDETAPDSDTVTKWIIHGGEMHRLPRVPSHT